MATWTKLDITRKPISQIWFCKRILIAESLIQLLNEIYRLNVWGIVFLLNQIRNVSPNLQIAIYLKDNSSLPFFFSMILKSTSFPLTVPNRTSNLGKDFSLQSLRFYSCMQFKIRKRLACWVCKKRKLISPIKVVRNKKSKIFLIVIW